MNFLQTVAADGQIALDKVKSGLVFLEHEGHVVLAWVEKEAPSAAPAIAAFLLEAEDAAATLAKHGASGLQSEIGAGLDTMQTTLLNLIQSTHLATNSQGMLKTLDVSAVALLNVIGKSLVTTALAAILSKVAPQLPQE